MPTSARKSSVGGAARRGPQKAHIPFNADDLGRGKKTGFAVTYVDHKSDEFEPFDQIMSQADQRTPPRVKNKRGAKKRPVQIVEEEENEEDGEMSMEMEESNPGSPLAYFTNARRPSVSSTINGRPRATAHRSSDVDFDKVPSPRPRTVRKSLASTAGPSTLSQTTIAAPEFDQPDLDGGGFDDYDPPENDSPQQQRLHQSHQRRTSFTHLDQMDDDDDEAEEEEAAAAATQSRKGKGRATDELDAEPVPDDVEDDIAQGLQELENGADPEDQEEEAPPSKKSRTGLELAKKKAREKPPRKRIEHLPPPSPTTEDGVRRGKRHRYRPLEWWRQEKVVYGRRESGVTYVPHIKEIIRIPKEPIQPLGIHAQGGKRKRGSAKPRSKSKVAEDEGVVVLHNPEEGWDDNTDPHGVVLDFKSKDEVRRRIAFTAKMVQPKAAANNDWFFQKVFGDGNFIAAGQLIIPPKGKKPSKGTKDNTYVFYVIEGAVNLKVHNTSLILATGGMFLVPRGNMYYIENIGDRDAKLFFTQARKIPVGAEDDDDGRGSSAVGGGVVPRSSSAAVDGAPREKARGPQRAVSAKA